MKVKEAAVGRLVKSVSGRDSGRYFIIKEIVDGDYVYITDGMLRKIAKPKRKKLKHLELKPVIFEAIALKFTEGTKVFDQEVASAILGSDYYLKD